jgi:CheY-like chemotaxis protein
VELHGGRVEAISAGLGRGSEFAVSIPLPSRTTEPGAEGEDERFDEGGTSSVSASGPQRVLVVDDNEDIAESTSKLLALIGHEVKVALDGEQALRLAASFHPTTVLLDIGMPGLDGYQLCRKFRAEPGKATMVAVTGYGEPQNRARAKEAGFDHYLLKPVDLETLESLLQQPARSPAD